tara:strand:+ start:423 stop:1610 length:1188 start_codon:yes stop_codon:yes gene_type:complete
MALGNITLRSTGTAVTNLSSNVNANISGTITLKNAPMTHSEVDMNFLEIAEDVASLQNATTSFVGLTDTPANFSGAGGKYLRINSGATAVEFDTLTTDDVTEGANLYYTDARADARITAALIDEDNMASDSATRLPSQQSVKAYVDSQILTKDNTDEITEGTTNLYFTDARADARIVAAGSANWNTAYSWGNHASAGYLTSFTETFTSLVQDTTPQLGGTLDANSNTIDMGTNIITDAKVGQWDTAYGWGNHASAGYLTAISGQSIGALSDVTITSVSANQILKYTGSAWVNQDINLNAEEDFDIKTADFNATESKRFGIDTTSNSVTVTLPASPGTGRSIMFAQAGGDFSVNNFVINPNGKNINGSSGNYTQSTNLDFASIGVFYNGTEWRKYG